MAGGASSPCLSAAPNFGDKAARFGGRMLPGLLKEARRQRADFLYVLWSSGLACRNSASHGAGGMTDMWGRAPRPALLWKAVAITHVPVRAARSWPVPGKGAALSPGHRAPCARVLVGSHSTAFCGLAFLP